MQIARGGGLINEGGVMSSEYSKLWSLLECSSELL